MPRGGKRQGAGRTPKSLKEKLLNGNPGKHEIRVNKTPTGEFYKFTNANASGKINSSRGEFIKYETVGQKTECIPEYIDMASKEGGETIPAASEIYHSLAEFIKSAGCEELVAPFLLEDFAFLRRGYLECEYINKKMGRVASGKRSPYFDMAIEYHKQMIASYTQIWATISKNSETAYGSKNDFLELITNRGF